jgi:chromosome partitioning protein
VENLPIDQVIKETEIPSLDIVPATVDLSSADIELLSNEKRSHLLFEALRNNQKNKHKYDYILIDCPPSLNLLTVNAMVASHSVLIPLQSEFFALEGLSQLLLTVKEVRQTANENLRVEGIVLTMFDSRNNLSKQVEADARSNLRELVFKTVIPRNVRVSEAPSYSMPVLTYDPSSKGSKAYMSLAKELLANNS